MGSGHMGPDAAGATASSSVGSSPPVIPRAPKAVQSVTERISVELAYQANKQLSIKPGAMPAVVVYSEKPDEKKTKASSKKIFGRKPDGAPSAAAGAAPGPIGEEAMDKGQGPMDVEGPSGTGTV